MIISSNGVVRETASCYNRDEPMNLFFNQVFAILTTPPGNLVYYLLMIIPIAGAMQGSIPLLRSGDHPIAKRSIVGLVILLVIQLIPFMLSPLIWLGIIDYQLIMPPIDRAFSLLSLIWISWLWIFPNPAPKADVGTVILSLLTFIVLGVSITYWIQNTSTSFFNNSFQDNIWQIFTLVIIGFALIILLIRRPTGFGFGLGTLLLAGAGHLVFLLIPQESSNFSGLVRLTQIAMYPILLSIPQRIPFSSVEKIEDKKDDQTFLERRRFSTDPKTFHSLLNLAAEANADQVGPGIIRGIGQSMLADLCFLVIIGDNKSLNISCGYDLIREEVLSGAMIEKDAIPLLSNAILRGKPIRLPANNNSADIQGLGQIIGLSNPGNVMSIPVEGPKRGSVIGAILLLSPYSNRVWNAEDQSYLSNVSGSIVPILERGHSVQLLTQERDTALSQVTELESKIQSLSQQLPSDEQQTNKDQQTIEKMSALSIALEESQKMIAQLQADNQSLQKSLDENEKTGTSDQIEQQFRMTLEDLAHLQNELGQANTRYLELAQKSKTTSIPDDQVEVLASISQELRQPMSSIVGYTDLLLGESVGILGALQRKFLERIKASTERIGRLTEDLIQITSIETGRIVMNPEIIDLNLIIDNAVAYTSTQLREKNITLRLDIPDSPPKIHIDREALQQILIHLLQNAGAATLIEGTVMLRVQFQQEDKKNFLLIQVVDSGGGIPSEDLPKVFARRYRAENVLIQGLGDTGVGLSIAKTLAEAQSGRIWVETSLGIGSTISVLLPIESIENEEED
jgi:signal transduction histidine kinase